MNKLPKDYTAKDFKKIMFKKLTIDVGPSDKDIIEETIKGKITNCIPSYFPPYSPAIIEFESPRGKLREIKMFLIYEIKGIHI